MKNQRIRLPLVGLIGLLLPSGCAHLYDPIDESLSRLHCEVDAAQTWHYLQSRYAHVSYPHHFGAGFRAGYVNVCRGRGSCPPTLPPKSYWTLWYRNEAGRAKTVEWFNGFSAGASVAMQDGHAEFGELVTAPGITGSCDCFAGDWEYDSPRVYSDISDEPPPPGDAPWQLRDTNPAFTAPPDFTNDFPMAPGISPSPDVDAPSAPPEPDPETPDDPAPSPFSGPVPPAPRESASSRLPPVPAWPKSPPFGHSAGPTPLLRQNEDLKSSRDQSVEEGLDHNSGTDLVEPVPNSLDTPEDSESPAESDLLNDPPQVPDYQAPPPPPTDIPPLEDRFLPRGGLPTPDMKASRRGRRPKSLLEAMGRIQHTSHTAQ